MTLLLEVDAVSAGHGAGLVLEDVSLTLERGSSLALLGRNGVGKTTLVRTLMGLTDLRSGRITCNGTDITRLPTERRARLGLGWVPQERHVFPSLSVDEHLDVVARPGPWCAARVYELFPAIARRKNNRGNELSGGEQQMLAIGRALVTNPKLLLLDEPMEGLAPIVVEQLGAALQRLEHAGLSMLLVEQHARLALELTRRVVVLERGRVVHAGASADLAADREAQHRLLAIS